MIRCVVNMRNIKTQVEIGNLQCFQWEKKWMQTCILFIFSYSTDATWLSFKLKSHAVVKSMMYCLHGLFLAQVSCLCGLYFLVWLWKPMKTKTCFEPSHLEITPLPSSAGLKTHPECRQPPHRSASADAWVKRDHHYKRISVNLYYIILFFFYTYIFYCCIYHMYILYIHSWVDRQMCVHVLYINL